MDLNIQLFVTIQTKLLLINKDMILCSQLTTELSDLIGSIEESGEKVLIAIKGAFREYLICTNKKCIYSKKSFNDRTFFRKR